MVNVSAHSLLVPAVALATAGAVALSPALIAPPTATLAAPAVQIPAVHIADIQLAGIGQDIYYAIQPWVAYAVEVTQYAVSWIPPLSSQIGILYFEGIQPVVEATVNALAGIVQDPFNLIGVLNAYGTSLFYTGFNFVSAELAWLGFPPLPPLPPLASVASTPSAASTPKASRAAAVVVEVELPAGSDAAEVAADV
ncbi:MAG: hypothetical protein WBD88_05445, partial [Mycobacterium sp.]